jgi:hypothetical protein
MKKYFINALFFCISAIAYGQTAVHSFEIQSSGPIQGFTKDQVEGFISKANFETYRLRDQRRTLSFDNGFEIVLQSADEALHESLIGNAASYPTAAENTAKLPVFHMTPGGWITAGYTNNQIKFQSK